jgi:hypothetical protein
MASSEVTDEIARLESRLFAVRSKIEAQEAVREMEEGGGGTRFKTQFTPIEVLYSQENELNTKLQTLKQYVAVGG